MLLVLLGYKVNSQTPEVMAKLCYIVELMRSLMAAGGALVLVIMSMKEEERH